LYLTCMLYNIQLDKSLKICYNKYVVEKTHYIDYAVLTQGVVK